MNKKLIGPLAIIVSFAVLFGVVGYINLSAGSEPTNEVTLNPGDTWTYTATEPIESVETDIYFGFTTVGQTLYCYPPTSEDFGTYHITILYENTITEEFIIEVAEERPSWDSALLAMGAIAVTIVFLVLMRPKPEKDAPEWAEEEL